MTVDRLRRAGGSGLARRSRRPAPRWRRPACAARPPRRRCGRSPSPAARERRARRSRPAPGWRRRPGWGIRRSCAPRYRRPLRRPAAAPLRTTRSATGSPPCSAWFSQAISAPIPRSTSSRPVRVELTPMPSRYRSAAGDEQRGDERESGRRKVGRDGQRAGGERLRAGREPG